MIKPCYADYALHCSCGPVLYARKDGDPGCEEPVRHITVTNAVGVTCRGAHVCFLRLSGLYYPVGGVSSFSNLTDHDDNLPVTVVILAARGRDELLARLGSDLVGKGIFEVPEVGGSISGGLTLTCHSNCSP